MSTTPLAEASATAPVEPPGEPRPWWWDAVIYQVYPRSFADGDGDGMGDLKGIRERLSALSELGVDAVWLSPFYASPQADAGYDVSDFRAVDPIFGTIQDFDALLAEAHARGLRLIVDLVPNHTSDEHAWFREALLAMPGSPERARYHFLDGRPGPNGEPGAAPPNDWQSIFGGPAWTRVNEADGQPGQWYLHLFASKQPDLNWENPEVREEFAGILRFWLDRGVDGFRIDVAHGLIKAPGLPDWSEKVGMVEGSAGGEAARPPYFDQDGVHEIYREWHRLLGEYDGERLLVAEAWVEPVERLMRYVRPDEMNQAFNFGFLCSGWSAKNLYGSIDSSLAAAGEVGRPTTWVLSNHDSVRHPSRFGLSDPTTYPRGISAKEEQPDEKLGLARARAASVLMFALPGSAYVYQGEELGLPEHTRLGTKHRQDPAFFRTGGKETGRDGCRVPLPWEAGSPSLGFSATSEKTEPEVPWLPQPATFRRYARDRQSGVLGSTLELYRELIRRRRELRLGTGTFRWHPLNDPAGDVLAFENDGVLALANLGTKPLPLPTGLVPMVESRKGAISAGQLAPDTAAWLGLTPS